MTQFIQDVVVPTSINLVIGVGIQKKFNLFSRDYISFLVGNLASDKIYGFYDVIKTKFVDEADQTDFDFILEKAEENLIQVLSYVILRILIYRDFSILETIKFMLINLVVDNLDDFYDYTLQYVPIDKYYEQAESYVGDFI